LVNPARSAWQRVGRKVMVEAILAASLVLATLLNLGAWHAGLSMPAEVYLGLAVALAGTAWV